MKLVIDIPERDYELACNYPDALIAVYAHYIKQGVPLPENQDDLLNQLKVARDKMGLIYTTDSDECAKALRTTLQLVDEVIKNNEHK